MRNLAKILALAPLCLAAACASGQFGSTSYPSGDEPDTVRAYGDFMVARVAALTNDPEMATRHYAAAIETAPPGTDVAERAVYSALLAGNYGVAAGLARRADDAGSEAGLVRLTLASDALARGRAKAAIDLIEASQLRAFNQMIAGNLQAWALLDTGKSEAARSLLEQNLTGDRRLDNATLHMLGLLQTAAGDDAGAAETFETLWASGARLAVGAETFAELLAARGERDRAIGILEQFRREVGYNASLETLELRIRAGGDIEPRRMSIRQGAGLSMFLPASALMAQSEDDAALPYLVLAMALDPQLHQARTLLAQALIRSDRPDDAIRILKDVPEGSPYYAAARGLLASTLLREERADEALSVAADALEARPDRNLKMQLADLYRSLDRFAEAETILSEVIAADEGDGRGDWRVHFIRGAVRERQADWTGAEADLQRALAIEPENATVLNYLGYSWIDRGINLEAGFGLIRRAVELEPESGHIVDSLGWAHYRLGQYEEAVDYLERAVTLLPGDPVLNDHLGDAYWKAGRRKEAGFQWARALKLDPSAEDRAKIERKLTGGVEVDPPAPGASVAR